MLRALRKLLRPEGVLAFTTILVTPGLPPAARRRAARAGPVAVSSRSDPRRLLVSAGFAEVGGDDLTDDFLATARLWLQERKSHATALAALEPPGAFEERLRDGEKMVAAIEEGLLRRGMFWGVRRTLRR